MLVLASLVGVGGQNVRAVSWEVACDAHEENDSEPRVKQGPSPEVAGPKSDTAASGIGFLRFCPPSSRLYEDLLTPKELVATVGCALVSRVPRFLEALSEASRKVLGATA